MTDLAAGEGDELLPSAAPPLSQDQISEQQRL